MKKVFGIILMLGIQFVCFGKGIFIHYKSQYPQTFMTYSVNGGNWSGFPGVEATASVNFPDYSFFYFNADSLEFYFNNGTESKDDNFGKNYKIEKSGKYVIENNTIKPISNFVIQVHYKTNWEKPKIKYSVDNKGWSISSDGFEMERSTLFPGYRCYTIRGSELDFVFNNGQDIWDNPNGGGNYRIASSGIYKVEDKTVKYVSKVIPKSNEWFVIQIKNNVFNGNEPYINYKADERDWEKGVKLAESNTRNNHKYFKVNAAKKLEFYITDKNGKIAKGSTFTLTKPGYYYIDNKDIKLQGESTENSLDVEREIIEDIKIKRVSRRGSETLEYKRIDEKKVELVVENKRLKERFVFQTSQNDCYGIKIYDSANNLYGEYPVLFNPNSGFNEAGYIMFREGKNTIEIIKSNKPKNISLLIEKLMNFVFLTQNAYAGEQISSYVEMVSMGTWKTCAEDTIQNDLVNGGYRKKKTEYNIWFDFRLPKTRSGFTTIKVVPVGRNITSTAIGEISGGGDLEQRGVDIYSVGYELEEAKGNSIISTAAATTGKFDIIVEEYGTRVAKVTKEYNFKTLSSNNTIVEIKDGFLYEKYLDYYGGVGKEYLGNMSGGIKQVFEYVKYTSNNTVKNYYKVEAPSNEVTHIYCDGFYYMKPYMIIKLLVYNSMLTFGNQIKLEYSIVDQYGRNYSYEAQDVKFYEGGNLISSTYTPTRLGLHKFLITYYDKMASRYVVSNTVNVDVVLGTPQNIRAILNKDRKWIICWSGSSSDGVLGATGYEIYRDNKLIGNTESTSFVDNELQSYRVGYFVRAYRKTNNILEGYSQNSGVIRPQMGKIISAAPLYDSNLSTITTTKLLLNWNSETDIFGYRIYKRNINENLFGYLLDTGNTFAEIQINGNAVDEYVVIPITTTNQRR